LAVLAGTFALAAPQDFMATPQRRGDPPCGWVMDAATQRGKPFAVVDNAPPASTSSTRMAGWPATPRRWEHAGRPHGGRRRERAQDGSIGADERTTPADASKPRPAEQQRRAWFSRYSALPSTGCGRVGLQGARPRPEAAKVSAMRVSWGCVVVPVSTRRWSSGCWARGSVVYDARGGAAAAGVPRMTCRTTDRRPRAVPTLPHRRLLIFDLLAHCRSFERSNPTKESP
jgi:hypothetical protein